LRKLLRQGVHHEIAARAACIESRTNLLFSFEKMALRDAVKSAAGAEAFARGLDDFLRGRGTPETKFERWAAMIEALPRKQTRALTWPLATLFGFIAAPEEHFFFKPNVTRLAARAYGVDLPYVSHPNAESYRQVLDFAALAWSDLADLRPRDMIDIQSFLWGQGSDEYARARSTVRRLPFIGG
jgi:hypothetical protein